MSISQEGRTRAAAAFRRRIGNRSPQSVADLAEISDPSTVRDFLAGERWPRSSTRNRLEDAFQMRRGQLLAIAVGDEDDEPEDTDPVVVSIERSNLTRSNRHRLLSLYFEMLDEQREGVRSS